MKTYKFIIALIVMVILCPTLALALYKPSRVFAPTWFGVTCVEQNICIDDRAYLPKAKALRAEAIAFVKKKLGHIDSIPRIIFCHSLACSDRFGEYHAAAYAVGKWAIVIRTKGWHKHFVRHELIHHLQAERLGVMKAYFFTPTWFFEGMAYSLSEDPRRPIPNRTLEGYRVKFEKWYREDKEIWHRAKNL